mmetsp:Transcript_34006/g.66993  ORF Transcript_34006/g.66993 Transcript_34006/m.66993 type:complete len:973 (+) Transcript_34006:194-3112(+)
MKKNFADRTVAIVNFLELLLRSAVKDLSDIRSLNNRDPCYMLYSREKFKELYPHLEQAVKHPYGSAEWLEERQAEADAAEATFKAMSEEELLRLWLNYHFSTSVWLSNAKTSERTVDNFGSDLSDSEVLLRVFNQIAPADKKLKYSKVMQQLDLHSRARQVLENIGSLIPVAKSIILPSHLVHQLHPDMVAALVGLMFTECPNLPALGPLVEINHPANIRERQNVYLSAYGNADLDWNEDGVLPEDYKKLWGGVAHIIPDLETLKKQVSQLDTVDVNLLNYVSAEVHREHFNAKRLVKDMRTRSELAHFLKLRVRSYVVQLITERLNHRPVAHTDHRQQRVLTLNGCFLTKSGFPLPSIRDLMPATETEEEASVVEQNFTKELRLVEEIIGDHFNSIMNIFKTYACWDTRDDADAGVFMNLKELTQFLVDCRLLNKKHRLIFSGKHVSTLFNKVQDDSSNDSLPDHELQHIASKKKKVPGTIGLRQFVEILLRLACYWKPSVDQRRVTMVMLVEHVNSKGIQGVSPEELKYLEQVVQKSFDGENDPELDEEESNDQEDPDEEDSRPTTTGTSQPSRPVTAQTEEKEEDSAAQNETREEKDDDEMTDLQKELLEAAKKNKKRKHGFRTLTTKIGKYGIISNLEILSYTFGIAVRLFGLFRLMVFKYAKSSENNIFAVQQFAPEVSEVFSEHLPMLRGMFVKYATLKTVAIDISDGTRQDSEANTIDYAEFLLLLKDANLYNTKFLNLTEVYSIFANLQTGNYDEDEESAIASVAVEEYGEVQAVIQEAVKEEKTVELDDYDKSAQPSLRFQDFLTALSAIASFRFPNPYETVAIKLTRFFKTEFLDWAYTHKFEQYDPLSKNGAQDVFKHLRRFGHHILHSKASRPVTQHTEVGSLEDNMFLKSQTPSGSRPVTSGSVEDALEVGLDGKVFARHIKAGDQPNPVALAAMPSVPEANSPTRNTSPTRNRGKTPQ